MMRFLLLNQMKSDTQGIWDIKTLRQLAHIPDGAGLASSALWWPIPFHSDDFSSLRKGLEHFVTNIVYTWSFRSTVQQRVIHHHLHQKLRQAWTRSFWNSSDPIMSTLPPKYLNMNLSEYRLSMYSHNWQRILTLHFRQNWLTVWTSVFTKR